MVVCPVCEHAQAGGAECEVCGRVLEVPPDPALPISPLDGLESTLRPGVPSEDAAPMPELERTGAEPVAAPAVPGVPDLERTGAAPVEAAVVQLPDLERSDDGAPADEPTPYPAVVVCRYCRTPAAVGEKLCSRCGMRLPTADVPVVEAGADEVRLCSCGLPVRGSRCPSCGARMG